MPVDILILNTAVTDLRSPDFEFADKLVGKGGLAKCKTEDIPDYSQKQIHSWIEDVSDKRYLATAGGPGNAAPLIARTGLEVAVGVLLGKGDYDGFDAQGKFFYDTMRENNIDVSAIIKHPKLPTGTTFIHTTGEEEERVGIAYFPNANNDFNFEYARGVLGMLEPKIVYYMYSGLSDRGDANNGQDLANFVRWCRENSKLTIADSHILVGKLKEAKDSEEGIAGYRLLEPLLKELDIFFTSSDEAELIAKTLDYTKALRDVAGSGKGFYEAFIKALASHNYVNDKRTRLFGLTVKDGAYFCETIDGKIQTPRKVESRFMAGEVKDLVGAGDAFRAGLLTYIAKNLPTFKDGTIRFDEAVQMGNLFAALYIKAPLNDRYGNIKSWPTMLEIVKNNKVYSTFDELQADLVERVELK